MHNTSEERACNAIKSILRQWQSLLIRNIEADQLARPNGSSVQNGKSRDHRAMIAEEMPRDTMSIRSANEVDV